MIQMTIKYTIGFLAKINLPIGICICLIYPTNPNIVATAAFVAFISYLVDHCLTYLQIRKRQELVYAEGVERSLLRSIRNSLALEHPVSLELIKSSVRASEDAETTYYEVFDMHRPEFGIPVSRSSEPNATIQKQDI